MSTQYVITMQKYASGPLSGRHPSNITALLFSHGNLPPMRDGPAAPVPRRSRVPYIPTEPGGAHPKWHTLPRGASCSHGAFGILVSEDDP